jgi:hypothetical protein
MSGEELTDRVVTGCAIIVVVAILVSLLSLCGCSTYSKQVWTPEGFNYTLSRDRQTHDLTDYWGLTWNLKP